MGRHTAQRDHRIAHTALLTLSILSVGSPIGLAMATSKPSPPENQTEQTIDSLDTDWLALPQGPPTLDLQFPIEKAAASPTSTTTRAKAKAHQSQLTTPKPEPVTRTKPTPTVTTKTSRPTVAQRQIAKAATTTTTTTKAPTKVPTKDLTKAPVTNQSPTKTGVVAPQRTVTTTTQVLPTPPPPPAKSSTTTTTTESSKEPPSNPSNIGQRIVSIARTYVGRNLPYRMGGDSLTTGIDCSHFVHRVLTEAGLKVPYQDSAGLAAWTTRTNDPQPGDLVLYRGHVGIYAGNGMMVHHGKAGGAFFIKVYKDNFIGFGRMPI